MSLEKINRIKSALEGNKRILKKALSYSPEFQDKELIEDYQKNVIKVEKMLKPNNKKLKSNHLMDKEQINKWYNLFNAYRTNKGKPTIRETLKIIIGCISIMIIFWTVIHWQFPNLFYLFFNK